MIKSNQKNYEEHTVGRPMKNPSKSFSPLILLRFV